MHFHRQVIRKIIPVNDASWCPPPPRPTPVTPSRPAQRFPRITPPTRMHRTYIVDKPKAVAFREEVVNDVTRAVCWVPPSESLVQRLIKESIHYQHAIACAP